MDCSVFLDAETYSNNHRLVKEIVTSAAKQFFPLEEFKHRLDGQVQCSMLDLGCGTCENTKWFGNKVGANLIFGIDWNSNFLEFAAGQPAPDEDGWNCQLDLRRVNLNEPNWEAALPAGVQFDLVTSFLTLHWVRNLTNCLAGLRRLVTPGRTLMFHVVGIRPGQNFQATVRTLAATEKWGPVIRSFMHATRWQDPTIADWRTAPDPAAAFRDILTAGGFTVAVCARMPFTYATESEAECRGHLRWLVPFTAELPPGDQAALMDDFMEVYGRFTKQDGPGRYVWENEVLVVLAVRGVGDDLDAAGGDAGAQVGGCQ